MSDDERVKRLEALARTAWCAEYAKLVHSEVDAMIDIGGADMQIQVCAHSRCLDMLEAALCVGADEPYSVRLEACKKTCEGYWEQWKRGQKAEAELAALRAGVERLAEECEQLFVWPEVPKIVLRGDFAGALRELLKRGGE